VSDLASAIVAGLDDDALDALAERLAPRLEAGWRDTAPVLNRWMAPAAAADYLGVKPKRIYDLKSARAIEPDGYDGRTPLFTRATLDGYARGRST
jgi:hypothetical protein